MSLHVKLFIAIVVLGTLGIVGARFAIPELRDAWQRETSDASAIHGRLTVGMDNWIGYFPLCSPEMQKRVRGEGYSLRCEDDKADYGARFKRMADGELDFAVATVDAYVLNGAKVEFPATIVAVLDESKGGDAIVARRSVVASLDALKKNTAVSVAFTPASPSEHLMKSIAAHFDVPVLRRRGFGNRVEAAGSSDALDKLLAGKADVAVLWEPDVSRALADPQIVKLIGTEDTDKLIVDVLLASRRVLQEKPEAVQVLLKQYFEALRHYNENPEGLREDVGEFTGLDEAQVETVLKAVAWTTLTENGAQWFGVTPSGLPGEEALVRTIESTVAVLIEAGDFDRNPLPDGDPYRITNRQSIAALYLAQAPAAPATGGDPLTRAFKPLDEAGWAKLKEVGTLRIEPIAFGRGTSALDEEGQRALDRIAAKLRHYPNYRVVVKGHTGLGGDSGANLELSKQRAQAVAEHLLRAYSLDANRVRALGYGSSQPLPRAADESDRAYGYRLPRVEIALVADGY